MSKLRPTARASWGWLLPIWPTLTCTFTPLVGASLLRVDAEYGHTATAAKQMELGAEVDARAAADDFGLLPQMKRTEQDCYANVVELLRAAGRAVPPLGNVPNRYLAR